MGATHSDFAGERLAIAEFNVAHQMRKISPVYGLKYYVSASMRNQQSVECVSVLISSITNFITSTMVWSERVKWICRLKLSPW